MFNIIERILKISFDHWEYTVEGRMSHAIVHQRGWRAELWYRPYVNDCDNSPAPNHEAFLRGCRTRSSVFKIDVEVEGEATVLSARRIERDLQILFLKRGQWETRYFGLPSPKSKRSAYYCDLLNPYGH